MAYNNSKKVHYVTGVTPKGEALYAYLTKPETYQGKDTGKFSIQIKLNKKDTDDLIQKIESALEEAKETMELARGQKWSAEPMLGFHENADGDIIFKFKVPTTIRTKAGEELARTVPVFDARNNKMVGDKIGNGSTIRIAYTLVPFYVSKAINGISLRLNAVQVIDLVEYGGGGNAASFGFGVDEDGYDSSATFDSEDTDTAEAPVEDSGDYAAGDF